MHLNRRHAEHIARLLEREAREVAQLDDAEQLGIVAAERTECLVERQEVDGPILDREH
jgi:hypothetical protein